GENDRMRFDRAIAAYQADSSSILQLQPIDAGTFERSAARLGCGRQSAGHHGWIDGMGRIGEKKAPGAVGKRRLQPCDLCGRQPFLADAEFVPQPSTPLAVFLRHFSPIEIETAL